jgi:hypothetical protein
MVEQYMETAEENVRKAISSPQKNWDERLPILLLSYKASTHKTIGTMPISTMPGRQLVSLATCFSRLPTKRSSL